MSPRASARPDSRPLEPHPLVADRAAAYVVITEEQYLVLRAIELYGISTRYRINGKAGLNVGPIAMNYLSSRCLVKPVGYVPRGGTGKVDTLWGLTAAGLEVLDERREWAP